AAVRRQRAHGRGVHSAADGGAALESEPGTTCPVCAWTGIVWRRDLGHEPWSGPVCTGCGIVVPQPVLTPVALARARRIRARNLTSAA
ncbi:hypothetical protein AB0P40_14770, partial [Streptomyces sp. NPDC079189]